jgi:hypothetical protein
MNDDTTTTIRLGPAELEELRKPVNGQGGMQTLMLTIQSKISEDGSLQISPEELERIRRYATEYGEGGFQNRFRTILRHVVPASGPLDRF